MNVAVHIARKSVENGMLLFLHTRGSKQLLRRYPDLRIVAVGPGLPIGTGDRSPDVESGFERLPAYSGATVPASHRLPAHKSDAFRYASAGALSWFPERSCVFFSKAACAGSAVLLLFASAHGARAAARASHPPRIVSLMPSLTEDLVAIGAGSQIVAVDRYSADVPGARRLPQVADFASVDTEHIVRLHPDVVVGIGAQDRFLQPLKRAGIRTMLLKDDSFADIFADLRALGTLSGHARAAVALEASLRRRTMQLHRSIHLRRAPRVFVVLDASPIYTAGRGSYLSALIALAGGKNAADDLPLAYGQYSAEALLRLQPDALVADGSTGIARFLGSEPWRSLRAVRERHVFIIQPADILERPGPRYNEGLRWLIERLQSLGA